VRPQPDPAPNDGQRRQHQQEDEENNDGWICHVSSDSVLLERVVVAGAILIPADRMRQQPSDPSPGHQPRVQPMWATAMVPDRLLSWEDR
jgi:hypothetical protein